MIRITELRLPLDHAEEALRPAVLKRLGLAEGELTAFTVFKRSYDARKKAAIQLIYTVDCEVPDEAALLQRFAGDPHVRVTPDTGYKFVGHASADFPADKRPIVIGFGPCGIFAALILAQMGLRPIVLERGKQVRERTKDTWGLWRKKRAQPGIQCAVRRRRRGHVLRRQAVEPDQRPEALPDPQGHRASSSGRVRRRKSLYVSKPHIGTFRLVSMVEEDARRPSNRSAARSASSRSRQTIC